MDWRYIILPASLPLSVGNSHTAQIRPEENDTWKLMEAISCTPEGVVDVMSRIEGPFAFVLWNVS